MKGVKEIQTNRSAHPLLSKRLLRLALLVAGPFTAGSCVTETKVDTRFQFKSSQQSESRSTLESRIEALEEKVAKLPERVDIRRELATAYFKNEQYDKAVSVAREAINRKPEDAQLHFMLGRFYHHMDRFEEAEPHFERALKYSRPGFTGLHLALGCNLGFQEKYDRAIEQFNQALEIEPDQPTALYYLGCCYDAKGQTAKALEYFERCAAQDSPYKDRAVKELSRIKSLQSGGNS